MLWSKDTLVLLRALTLCGWEAWLWSDPEWGTNAVVVASPSGKLGFYLNNDDQLRLFNHLEFTEKAPLHTGEEAMAALMALPVIKPLFTTGGNDE